MIITDDMARAILRRIYEAALNAADETHGLKDITLYLSDDPITGKRGIQLENAYETAKALARVGWIWIENHEAIAVQLTDVGIRQVEKR